MPLGLAIVVSELLLPSDWIAKQKDNAGVEEGGSWEIVRIGWW